VKLKENVFMAQRWLSVRRSRELHCILLWTVHVKRMQKLARRKLRIVRAVRAYYAELRQRILDRHAFERKEVGHVEAKERSRTILEERASVMETARIFRIALVPMVATVLRNIQSVEFEKRQALNDEARQAAWGFEQMFATGIVAAVQRKKERLERQLRELLERQQALVVSLLAARTAVEGDEAAARRRLQLEVIGPEKAAVHAQAERNRQAAKARSAELQRLAKAHAAEQFRLEQQRCRAVDEEEERWRSRVGAAQVGRDLLYACRQQGGYHSQGLSSTMAEADRQLQRFYTARGPSHIASAVTEENAARSTASGGLLDSEAVTLGKAASYEEYAAWWRAEYASAQRKGQRGSNIVAANSACLSLSELDGTAEGSLATSPSRPAAAPAPVVTMLTRPPVDVVSPMERARIAVQQPPFTRVSSSPLQGRCKKPALVPPEHRLLSSSRSHGSAADDAPPSSPRSASSRSSSSSSSSSSFDEMKEFRRIQAAARRFGPASGSQSSRHLFDSQAEHYSQATAASYDGSATASFNSPRKGSAKKAKVVKPFGTLKVSPTASIALEKYRQLRGPSQPNSPMTTPETLAFRAGPLGSVR
jgi:hypothetical protein